MILLQIIEYTKFLIQQSTANVFIKPRKQMLQLSTSQQKRYISYRYTSIAEIILKLNNKI